MKALCVVAHPDDHILWVGGTILRLAQWTWHVLSLCNSHNSNIEFQVQKTAFGNSCKELGVDKCHAEAFHDHRQVQLTDQPDPRQVTEMKQAIQEFADDEYDLVFAHSIQRHCEYSFHANHAEARDAVRELVKEGALKTKALLHFCYKSGGSGQPVIADLHNADYKVVLTAQEVQQKGNLKRGFAWAQGDLRSLNLWVNDEPRIEAFQVRDIDIQLPPDFRRNPHA